MATKRARATQPSRVTEIFAVAAQRGGRVEPTWPEKGTGRTAALAVCGHCGGKPLIIRLCGHTASGIRYCAVCEKCGAHRAIQAAPGSAAI